MWKYLFFALLAFNCYKLYKPTVYNLVCIDVPEGRGYKWGCLPYAFSDFDVTEFKSTSPEIANNFIITKISAAPFFASEESNHRILNIPWNHH